MTARFVAALDELAHALLAEFPAPLVVAEGSGPIAITPQGLIPCADCGSPRRPGAVHFARLTDLRPCVGSWGRSAS
jgi:hypothetical protein